MRATRLKRVWRCHQAKMVEMTPNLENQIISQQAGLSSIQLSGHALNVRFWAHPHIDS
jgi:hypothetical protein